MFKVDFHTHSEASPDGGIKPELYSKILEDGLLDYVAITDHNTVAMALELQQTHGDKVIVGEEIMSTEGELIGLFLTETIAPGLSSEETAKAIKAQGGLVYIPHPFETVRKGLDNRSLDKIIEYIDIVEVSNGRAVFQNFGPEAATWARLNRKLAAASSDAHGHKGIGTTYTVLPGAPSAENLLELLTKARLISGRPPLKTLLYPKANRLRKRLTNG